MRLVHRYYRYHYNKLLQLRSFDESVSPSMDKIPYCYESLSGKSCIKVKDLGKDLNYVMNHDHVELNMTKNGLDFDKRFLHHLRTSIVR